MLCNVSDTNTAIVVASSAIRAPRLFVAPPHIDTEAPLHREVTIETIGREIWNITSEAHIYGNENGNGSVHTVPLAIMRTIPLHIALPMNNAPHAFRRSRRRTCQTLCQSSRLSFRQCRRQSRIRPHPLLHCQRLRRQRHLCSTRECHTGIRGLKYTPLIDLDGAAVTTCHIAVYPSRMTSWTSWMSWIHLPQNPRPLPIPRSPPSRQHRAGSFSRCRRPSRRSPRETRMRGKNTPKSKMDRTGRHYITACGRLRVGRSAVIPQSGTWSNATSRLAIYKSSACPRPLFVCR